MLSDLHMSRLILFHFSCFCSLLQWNWTIPVINVLFKYLQPMKNNVRFKYVPWKNVWFFSISIVWAHFSYKADKFRFWKSLKYLMFFDKNGMRSDLNRSHGIMSDFVSCPLFGLPLIIKVKNFNFESHQNTFIWICLVRLCLIWFKLRCLNSIWQ